jgi:cell division protein FtsI (penicillin-binding protein 3)
VFDTNPGYMPLGKYTIRDVHNFGVLTTTTVITRVPTSARPRSPRWCRTRSSTTIRSFGYGSAAQRLPGRIGRHRAPPDRWSGSTKTTMSYGYGLNVTPLQIARAYSRAGQRRAPAGTDLRQGAAQPFGADRRPEDRPRSRGMMETVVTQGGAKAAGILGYRVAGKTGTARQASGGGYATGRYASLFAGVVPATNPRFATVIVINDSAGRRLYGGLVSAPVFHNVMEGALRLMDVPPDDIETWLAAQARPMPRAANRRPPRRRRTRRPARCRRDGAHRRRRAR